MKEYIEEILQEFSIPENHKSQTSWNDLLFKVNENSPQLNLQQQKLFHRIVMKGMFLMERGRPDIGPGVSFLSTRVTEPNYVDWKKLTKIISFLKNTKNDLLALYADDTQSVHWYIDASYATHTDLKSHTGACMTLGKGILINYSTKQKVNSQSSTEAELNGVDDKISKILWVSKFIKHQGFEIKNNVVFQDDMSAIKLEENSKDSSGSQTYPFGIKMFYIKDIIERKLVKIEHYPAKTMIADYLSKPLIGKKFKNFRNSIMNIA